MLSHINVGTGKDATIRETAQAIKRVIGYKGRVVFNTLKSDGAPRKLIDVSCLSNMGWKYSVDLEDGLEETYKWYLKENV
jgi:GDP-L-fucose synthase